MAYTENEWLAKVEECKSLCQYCGVLLTCANQELTKDHVVPISRGGADELPNILPCCRRCNWLKGKMTAVEFLVARPGLTRFAQRNEQVFLYYAARRIRQKRSTVESAKKLASLKEMCPPRKQRA